MVLAKVVLAKVVLAKVLAELVLAKTLPIARPKSVALSARRSLKMERRQSKFARRALAVVVASLIVFDI